MDPSACGSATSAIEAAFPDQFERNQDGELIEVAGIIIVDRGPRQCPQVADGGSGLDLGPVQSRGLLQGLRREFRQQPAGAHGRHRETVQFDGGGGCGGHPAMIIEIGRENRG